MCHIFLAYDDGDVVGYSIVLALESNTRQGSAALAPSVLSHESIFLHELSETAKCIYIDQIAVSLTYTKSDVGHLIIRYILKFGEAGGYALVAGIIHAQNVYSMRFFLAFKFKVIDFYESAIAVPTTHTRDRPSLWFRLVRVLDHKAIATARLTSNTATLLTKIKYSELSSVLTRNNKKIWKGLLMWQGWHVHGTVTQIHNSIPISGFCDYTTIGELSKVFAKSESQAEQERLLNKVLDAVRSVLTFYRSRADKTRMSITSELHNRWSWLVLSNSDIDTTDVTDTTHTDVLNINLTMDVASNSRKINSWFNSSEDWSQWLKAYQDCMAADMDVYTESINLRKNKDRGTVKKECNLQWIHIFGPTNWDRNLYTGTFATIVLENALTKDDWPDLLLHLYACSSVINDVILRFNQELLLTNTYLSAKAAIMSRNFSHNVGSHSLANPRMFTSLDVSGERTKSRLGTFFGYTQGRLDFLARSISSTNDRPEPLFFIGDVLNGFFRQGALLDTLVEDTGFPANRIAFKVMIKSYERDVQPEFFAWQDDESRFNPESKPLRDVLVAIPGGMIGCHALYAFIENCLRNAVKYGARRNIVERLEITFHLEKCEAFSKKSSTHEEAWLLRISDNISNDPNQTIVSNIRKLLNQPLIGDDGKPTAKGHGIQEMKLCAANLAGGDTGLQFPDDKNCDIRPCSPCEPGICSCASNEYQAFVDSIGEEGSPENILLPEGALRCSLSTETKNSHLDKWLCYDLLMPCPVLIGLVDEELCGKQRNDGLPSFVCRFSDLSALAEKGPFFGVILDRREKTNIGDTLRQIAALHPALPFRLMVVAEETRSEEWGRQLREHEGRREDGLCDKDRIPRRRLHILGNNQLWELLTGKTATQIYQYLDAPQGWESVVLSVYDAWLRAYKPTPQGIDSWGLCIGFDRPAKQVLGDEENATTWGKKIAGFAKDGKSVVSIYVKSQEDQFIASANWPKHDPSGNAILDEEQRASLLVFDNHGRIFSDLAAVSLRASARFYQEHGVTTALNLYQALETPPGSSFGFGFFIYSLAEAALTRVAVLDERVAQSTLTDGRILTSRSLDGTFQKAGIIPLYCFKRDDEKWPDGLSSPTLEERSTLPFGFLSQTLLDAARETVALIKDEAEPKGDAIPKIAKYLDVWSREGLMISKTGSSLHFGYLADDAAPAISDDLLSDVDVLVIHEGVTDILQDQSRWKTGDRQKLYDCAPAIVRTSGRGHDSRYLGEFLPFVEFTEISGNIYRSLNKLALAKAVLGSAGGAI
jgi:hypothetical protein